MGWLLKHVISAILTLTLISDSRGVASLNEHAGYDEDLAKLAVIYCSATYLEDPSVSNWTFPNQECNARTQGFNVVETFEGDGTEAFGYIGVDHGNRRIVSAFKGSSTLRDWVTNLRTWLHYHTACEPGSAEHTFSPTASGNFDEAFSAGDVRILRERPRARAYAQTQTLVGNVHFGFCAYYRSLVAKGFGDRVASLADEYPDYTFFVTGHSLGAAAAAVCAADLTQRLGVAKERVVLYTLGEPRTGDGIFSEGLQNSVGTLYRVVHRRDIVPHLSLCCHTWGGRCRPDVETCPYQHPTEILYEGDMDPGDPFSVCNSTIGEDYACDSQSVDLSIADHLIYFQMIVGDFCEKAPNASESFQTMKARQEKEWAEFDEELRADYIQLVETSRMSSRPDIGPLEDDAFWAPEDMRRDESAAAEEADYEVAVG